jgi:hypothetical protein
MTFESVPASSAPGGTTSGVRTPPGLSVLPPARAGSSAPTPRFIITGPAAALSRPGSSVNGVPASSRPSSVPPASGGISDHTPTADPSSGYLASGGQRSRTRLRMAVIGMDLRRRHLLELILTEPISDICVIVGDARADAAIIDMDSYGAKDLLDTQRRRHPGRPLVLTATDRLPDDVVQDDQVLAKPVRAEELLTVIRAIRSRTFWSRGESSSSTLVHDATYYDPKAYLQGVLLYARRQALTRNRAVYVEGPWPAIMLFPSTGTALVPGGLEALTPYMSRSGMADQARITFAPAPLFSPHHPDSFPMDTLIWGVTLAASDGRLPAGTPLDRLCSLRSWPNFPRLANVPGGIAVAALWAREPHPLLETATMLDLPREHVFSFYSAVAALELLAPEHLAHSRREPDVLDIAAPSPQVEPHRPRRFSPGAFQAAGSPLRGLLRRVFDRMSVRSEATGGQQ